jgi:hypothetical protein
MSDPYGASKLGNGILSPEAVMLYEMFSRVGNDANGQAFIRVGTKDEQQYVEQVGNYYYVAYSLPGTLTSASNWKLKRVDVTGPITTKWADGSTLYNKKWDDRATYSYS